MIEQKIQELIDALNANTEMGRVMHAANFKMYETLSRPVLSTTITDSSGASVLTYDPIAFKESIAAVNTAVDKLQVPPPAQTSNVPLKTDAVQIKPALITIERVREVTHKILDLRAEKKLIPPAEPIQTLNKEYGYKKIVDCIGTDKAEEVFAKLVAILGTLKDL